MRLDRFIAVSAILLSICLMLGGLASADVGVRPLSMGGAFVGLADDANATDYNPAGLIQLEGISATASQVIANDDEIAPKDFVSLAGPLGANSAYGVSWSHSRLPFINFFGDDDFYFDADEYTLSLATGIGRNTSLGINARHTEYSRSDMDIDNSYDLSVFTRMNDQWTAGVMVLDFNRPTFRFSNLGDEAKVDRFWIAGAAFRPDASTIWTMDVNDVTNSFDDRSLRIGYEKKMDNGLALRAGIYNLGGDDNQSLTFGIGKSSKPGDAKPHDIGICFMTGDIDAVIGSFSYGF